MLTSSKSERRVIERKARNNARGASGRLPFSPESYKLDEEKEICNDMFKASKAIQDAMRADFEQLPPVAPDGRI